MMLYVMRPEAKLIFGVAEKLAYSVNPTTAIAVYSGCC